MAKSSSQNFRFPGRSKTATSADDSLSIQQQRNRFA